MVHEPQIKALIHQVRYKLDSQMNNRFVIIIIEHQVNDYYDQHI